MDSLVSPVRHLAEALLERASVTPDDAGCQAMLAVRLKAAGMSVESFRVGEVDNLFAWHGQSTPHLLLLGHTDVVPTGPEGEWASPPFRPTERDGRLYARGAADMKCSVAAFVVALESFLADRANHPGRISLLLTSDEEGPARDGVRAVVPTLKERGLLPDACLVGEPSSLDRLGDNLRIGRRGSIQARIRVFGRQGHTAYADPSDNPVHRAGPLLAALGSLGFDDGDEHFPSTRLQISNVQAGTGADNVTPGELSIWFNIRNNPNSSPEDLEERLRSLIQTHDPGRWQLDWRVSGLAFGPAGGPLPRIAVNACREELEVEANTDTGGGTSDGRFFGPLGIPVVELGPVNRSIHQIDEFIDLADLDRMPALYRRIIQDYLDAG